MSREAFEAWMSDDGKNPRAIERAADGSYLLLAAGPNWNVWQAALAWAYDDAVRIASEYSTCEGIAQQIEQAIRKRAKEVGK